MVKYSTLDKEEEENDLCSCLRSIQHAVLGLPDYRGHEYK